jgi:hypothetical protein
MIDPAAFQHDIDAVRDKLRARLGARGKTLECGLLRAGRSLPKPARQAGGRLVQLQRMVANPRLRRLVDPAQVDAALAELDAHLDTVKPGDRRKDRLLGIAGSAVFNLMILGALVIAFLRWRGPA